MAPAAAVLLSGLALSASAQSSTSTTLSASSNSITFGTPVTLTVSVTSNGGGVHPGTVGFCDLTVTPHCVSSELFGIKQLTAAGTASVVIRPSFGTHSYRAVFSGTRTASLSYNLTPVYVTAGGQYTSSTTISPASGNQVTATVTGYDNKTTGPTGTVTFKDSSNGNVSVGTASLGSSSALTQSFVDTSMPVPDVAPFGPSIGDLNNDGLTDAILQGNTRIYSLLSTGSGYTASTFGGVCTRLFLYDFNSDGNLDTLCVTSSGVTMYPGDGTGKFGTGVVTAGPIAWGFADFNYDGIPDLVGPSSSANNGLQVWFGTGTGSFTAGPSTAVAGTLTDLAVSDFNGDPVLDVAAVGTTTGGTPTAWIYDSDGSGHFILAKANTLPGSAPVKVLATDMNLDKVQDLAVLSSGTLTFLTGGSSGISPVTGVPMGNGVFTVTGSVSTAGSVVATGDLNGDGIPDFIVPASNNVAIYYGNGSGSYGSTGSTTAQSSAPYAFAIADANGDGLLDIISLYNTSLVGSINTVARTVSTPATSVTPTGAGTHNIVAVYNGDAYFTGSTSASTPVTVSAYTDSVTVNSATTNTTSGTAQLGGFVTYSASTAPAGPFTLSVNGGTPVNIGCSPAGTQMLGCGLTYNTTGLAANTYNYTITAAADTNYTTAAVGTGTLTVTQPATATITVPAQTFDPTAATANVSATLTYTGQTAPTGALSFSVNGTPTSNYTCNYISNGLKCVATFQTASLSKTSANVVTVTMPANGAYLTASGSGNLTATATPKPTVALVVTPTTLTRSAGGSVVFSASFTSGLPTGMQIGGAFNGTQVSNNVGLGNCSYTSTSASCPVIFTAAMLSSLPAGSYTFTVTAQKDANGVYGDSSASATVVLQ